MPSRSQQHAVAVVRRAPVRHVVHSLARVMASYFCNLHMFVFPSHCVKKMPPLHVNYRISERVVPLPRDDVTATLTDESLGEAWTSEKTLEFLLLSGAMSKAVWMLRRFGDWKTAYVIAVVSKEHETIAPKIYEKYKDKINVNFLLLNLKTITYFYRHSKWRLPVDFEPKTICVVAVAHLTGIALRAAGPTGRLSVLPHSTPPLPHQCAL